MQYVRYHVKSKHKLHVRNIVLFPVLPYSYVSRGLSSVNNVWDLKLKDVTMVRSES